MPPPWIPVIAAATAPRAAAWLPQSDVRKFALVQ